MRIPRSWISDFVNLSGVTDQVISDAFVRVGFEVEEVSLWFETSPKILLYSPVEEDGIVWP